MIANLFRSFGLVVLGFIVLGGCYPLCVMAIGYIFFPNQVEGSLLYIDNRKRGSLLIAQAFHGSDYLIPRPSVAGERGYNGEVSSGSQMVVGSEKMKKNLEKRVAEYRIFNQVLNDIHVPVDAVTTSASGLDPHISLENALLQARRIARARNISERQVRNIIRDESTRSLLDRLGKRHINVLECNRAIEQFARYTHLQTENKLRD